MPRAISNLDLDFLDELTAVSKTQETLCLILAEKLDTPEELELVRELMLRAIKIKVMSHDQRKFLRSKGAIK
jgi:hypothetical protein